MNYAEPSPLQKRKEEEETEKELATEPTRSIKEIVNPDPCHES